MRYNVDRIAPAEGVSILFEMAGFSLCLCGLAGGAGRHAVSIEFVRAGHGVNHEAERAADWRRYIDEELIDEVRVAAAEYMVCRRGSDD